MHYFLGLEVWQRTVEIFLSQEIYYGDNEKVWHDRMQIHAHSNGNGFEKDE